MAETLFHDFFFSVIVQSEKLSKFHVPRSTSCFHFKPPWHTCIGTPVFAYRFLRVRYRMTHTLAETRTQDTPDAGFLSRFISAVEQQFKHSSLLSTTGRNSDTCSIRRTSTPARPPPNTSRLLLCGKIGRQCFSGGTTHQTYYCCARHVPCTRRESRKPSLGEARREESEV